MRSMEMWIGRCRDLLICAGFALILWAPLGRWILSRIDKDKLPRCQALAVSLGMGAWGFGILMLGAGGLLYRLVLLLSASAIFLGFRLHRHLLPRNSPAAEEHASFAERAASFLMAGLSLWYVALALGASLAPETNFDSLNVHLPYARDAAAAHRAGFDPNNWSSVMPALPLMSYITAFVMTGVSLAKLFNALCYVLTAGVIYSFVRRWHGRMPALAAALLFWSCPVAVFESTTALIDLPLVLYSCVAVLALLEWTATNEDPFLLLSALSLGFASGCKYHAAFWIAPFVLVIAWHSRSAGRHGERPLRSALLNCLRYICVAGILFVPWLVRAWHYTGNPLFPAANGLFKSPYFPPAMAQAALAAYANEGVGRSPAALLKLPWTVTFHPGPFRGTLGFIFLFGVLVALLQPKRPQVRYGLLIAGVYFYTWAVTAQDIRYLLPLAPLLAVITAGGLFGGERMPAPGQDGTRHGTLRRRLVQFAAPAAILAGSMVALPAVYPSVVREWTYWHAYQSPWSYLLGRQSAQDFLRRDVPSIYVYDYINANLDSKDRILLLNEASRFYSQVPTLYSFTVEAERLLLEESEEGVMQRLAESRISHVLLNYNGIAPLPGVAPRRGAYFFLDKSFQAKHLETLCSINNVKLFRVCR